MRKLILNNKQVKLPFFMPVATKLSTKLVSLKEVEELGYETVISNSFLLYLNPGLEFIKKAKYLRGFTNTNLNFFTDSGGFQLLYDNFFESITEKGIKFRSPYDRSLHLITPEKSMEIQAKLNSDVVMCLDYMPRYKDSKKDIEKSVNLTYQWAKRCKESYKGKGKFFCIIQGGVYKDLRKKSAEGLISLDFDGYAIGGLGIGENREEMFKAVESVIDLIPKDKVRYLMGIGTPLDVKRFIKLGVDVFDSTYPTKSARHNLVFNSDNNLDLEKGKFKNDFKCIDPEISISKDFSRAYLHHLIKINEPLAKRIMTLHNLEYMKKLMS